MPVLLVLLIGLIIYIATLDGASDGFAAYLIPDFSQILDPNLIIAAMGQAFFSLSLGVGCMMIYGSYLKPGANLPKLTASVALLDTSVAFLAGLLIVPAIYVAQHNGVEVFSNGKLIGEGQLIFAILPALFSTMGDIGLLVGLLSFVLMSIASVTSTISTTEIPVAFSVENHGVDRTKATWLVTGVVLVFASLIILNLDWSIWLGYYGIYQYQLTLMGLFNFVTVGWLWQRGNNLHHAISGALTGLSGIPFVCQYYDLGIGIVASSVSILPVYLHGACPLRSY